jgi:hypothetical protein
MGSSEVTYFCERFSQLQNDRQPHETKWRQIAEFMRQVRLEFRSVYDSGQLPAETNPYVTSGVAGLALDNFVGGVYGYLSNEANRWVTIKTHDDDLNEFHSAKVWLSTVSRRILNSYGPAMCPFYAQVPEIYADAAGLGNGCFFSEWMPGQSQIHDRAFSPFDVFFDVDNYGNVDTVYRPFWFSKRQILQQFRDVVPPDRVAKARDGDRFMLLHVVTRNDGYSDGMIGPKGFPFTDVYVGLDDKFEFQRKGRYDFYQCARWSGTGTYGHGLGHRALPDVKTHNAMDRAMLEHAEWQVHPAPLLPDRNTISTARPRPRTPIYGGMSMSGRRMVDFLAPSGNIAITHEMMRQREETIREGFFFGLMQLVGRSGMTVIETMTRDEERMRLLGPHIGRIQREFLTPSVTQRFAMLWRAGQLPPPPKELQREALKIEFTSPMANAQKSASAAGTLRLIDATIAMTQVDPEAKDNIDTDAAIRVLQDGFSAPPEVLKSPEKVQALREARQQQALMQQQLAMGQQGADIAAKLAVAQPRNMGMNAA